MHHCLAIVAAASVADYAALGPAGGARGEQHVRRSGVGHAFGHSTRQRRCGHTEGRLDVSVGMHLENGEVPESCENLLRVLLDRHQCMCDRRRLEHGGDACGREVGLDWAIGLARAEHAEQRDDHAARAPSHEGDDLRVLEGGEVGGAALNRRGDLRIAGALAAHLLQASLVRPAGRHLEKEIVQRPARCCWGRRHRAHVKFWG
mmetsp:Transcript_64450/g.163344  ORF Transcript_64450/g.163344 Transcript_64450/m.163344 type:complete len:204 (+) Transcript_64450:2745-3356(+)